MKIITPGRNQTGWAGEFTCTGKGDGNGGCGAKLLVEQADVRFWRWAYFDEFGTDYFFVCAGCGCKTKINYNGPSLPDSQKGG